MEALWNSYPYATFEDNGAGLRGGAISIEGALPAAAGTLVLERTTLRGNDAGTSGGAIHGKLSTLTITNATFHDNFAVSGGALLIDQADGDVTNATFSHNTAVTAGASFHAANTDASRFTVLKLDRRGGPGDGRRLLGQLDLSRAQRLLRRCVLQRDRLGPRR